MSAKVPSSLIEKVSDAVLHDSPDPKSLQGELMNELGLSAENARVLLYQVIKQLNGAFFPPITELEVVHTEGCNLACSYCFEKNMLGFKRISPELACAAVDLLFDYSFDAPHLTVTHFGGEPTLNFPGIKLVTEYAENKATALGKTVSFNTTTNGVRLPAEFERQWCNEQSEGTMFQAETP